MHAGPTRLRLRRIVFWAAPLVWLGCGGDGGTDIVLPALTISTATAGVDLDPDGYGVSVDGSAVQPIGINATVTIDRLAEGPHTIELSGLAANCSPEGANPRSVTITPGATANADFAVSCVLPTGTIAVSVTAGGDGSDPDGFTLVVDGSAQGTIAAGATATLDGLTPGTHALGLTGLAANCQLLGENPRSVEVTAGQVIQLSFQLTCSAPPPTSGTLQITTATTGSNQDPDGYSIAIDGGAGQPIALNATLSLTSVSSGQHTIELLGVAGNCTLSGTNPRQASVQSGATTTVAFAVTCAAPAPGAGRVQITAATSGSSPDPDGYTARLDGGNRQRVGVNGSLLIEDVAPGSHSVQLSDIAGNCSLAGDNPRAVTVSSGQTASVQFAITCATPPPESGSLRISVATSGSPPDPDGYTVQVDQGATQGLTVNGSMTIASLAVGSHTVLLAGLATNCTASGNNPRSVSISSGQTATVSFSVSCVATGSAVNFRISNMYITQSTQNLAGTVPLVSGRVAYLRVFVVADQSTTAKPGVRVTFRNGSTITTRTISAPGSAVPTAVQEGSLGSSWNLPIDGSLIQPGLSISAEVDAEKQIAETNENDNTYPVSGTPLGLTISTAPLAKIRFVPIQQGTDPPGNVTQDNKDELVELARRLYPLSSINTDIRPVYSVPAGQLQTPQGWSQVLSDLDGVRVAEGSDRTYYGVARLDYQFGLVGLAFLPGRTAMGTDASGDVKRVVAHELGHGWNQFHTPCANPPDTDPNYPYGVGIGVYGFDVIAKNLKPPSIPDIMGYCIDPWISDYIYQRVLSYRAASAASQLSASTRQPALLVRGRIINGQPILEPSFHIITRPQLPERPGPYSIEGIASDGSSLFRISFAPAELADDPRGSRSFAFAVPLDRTGLDRLADLRLTGPGVAASAAALSVGRPNQQAASDTIIARREANGVALEWNPSAHPMIMVRDPDTGQVLSFARGGSARVTTAKGELELVASDGVRSRTARIAVTR